MNRYRVKFVADALLVDAYAETFGGTWTTSVDGWAFLRVPDNAVEAVEEEFERDDNVIKYEEITEAEDWKMLTGSKD